MATIRPAVGRSRARDARPDRPAATRRARGKAGRSRRRRPKAGRRARSAPIDSRSPSCRGALAGGTVDGGRRSRRGPAGRRRRRRSCASPRGRRMLPLRVPPSAMPAGTKVPHSDSAKAGGAARRWRPSARARRRRPADSRCPPSARAASSVAASSAAAHSAAAVAMIRMPMRERPAVTDPLAPAAGRQAEHCTDQGHDRHRHAGGGERQAEIALQRRHQRRHDAELAGRQHADGVEQGDPSATMSSCRRH